MIVVRMLDDDEVGFVVVTGAEDDVATVVALVGLAGTKLRAVELATRAVCLLRPPFRI